MDLKQVQKILFINFWLMISVTLLLVVIYENEWVGRTNIDADEQLVFTLQVLMELLTIVCVPFSLKLFAFKKIHRKLVECKGAALLPWGTARMNMLCIPMLANTFFYYQTMSPAFGYMAIILFLCLFFVYPSLERCTDETED